jgi:hypothetical protein
MNTLIIRNRFPALAAAVLAAAVIVGFARTYYLRTWFELPPLTRMAHVHGVLWTLWLALHYTQARLVGAGRADLHRRLGIAGALLGAVLVWTSIDLSIVGAATGRAPPGRNPLEFLSVPLGTTFVFAGFLTAALLMRGRREWHKRLMLLASLALLLPAMGRIDGLLLKHFGLPRAIFPWIVTAGFVAWACVNDWRKRGSIHPAYLYGGIALLAAIPLRVALGYTDSWVAFAHWLTH